MLENRRGDFLTHTVEWTDGHFTVGLT